MTITLIIFTCIILFWELSTFLGFGGIALVNDIDLTHYTINPLNRSIINNYETTDETPYITSLPSILSVFFKYYIKDEGLVFRFTKLAKKIDMKYKELYSANVNY